MHSAQEFFQNTADAVAGVDGFQRLCFWNRACERLFGVSFGEVRGRECHAVIAGTDLNGDVFCSSTCTVFKRLLSGEPVSDHDLVVRGADGNPVVVNVGAVVVPAVRRTRTRPVSYLIFRRVDSHRLIHRLAAECRIRRDGPKPSKYHLTVREMELLELAAKGVRTPHIAQQLSISVTTVRNHFRNILCKLGVHSRAEAVGLALRSNFF